MICPLSNLKVLKLLAFFPFKSIRIISIKTPQNFHGETRDQRLEEFLKLNPAIPVIGLPEGTALLLNENKLTYKGSVSGVLFSSTDGIVRRKEITPNTDLSFVLN